MKQKDSIVMWVFVFVACLLMVDCASDHLYSKEDENEGILLQDPFEPWNNLILEKTIPISYVWLNDELKHTLFSNPFVWGEQKLSSITIQDAQCRDRCRFHFKWESHAVEVSLRYVSQEDGSEVLKEKYIYDGQYKRIVQMSHYDFPILEYKIDWLADGRMLNRIIASIRKGNILDDQCVNEFSCTSILNRSGGKSWVHDIVISSDLEGFDSKRIEKIKSKDVEEGTLVSLDGDHGIMKYALYNDQGLPIRMWMTVDGKDYTVYEFQNGAIIRINEYADVFEKGELIELKLVQYWKYSYGSEGNIIGWENRDSDTKFKYQSGKASRGTITPKDKLREDIENIVFEYR